MHKPRSRLRAYERQGFCHVSQLLEILFARYGISSSELSETTGTSPAIPGVGILQPVAQMAADVPVARPIATVNSCRAQATFSWFQPAELTV